MIAASAAHTVVLKAVSDGYNKFKAEMINELMAAGTTTTVYRVGDFFDPRLDRETRQLLGGVGLQEAVPSVATVELEAARDITVEGLAGEPLTPAQVDKKKVFVNAVPDLKTSADRVATWKGHAFLTSAGPCTSPVNGPIN